MQKSENKYERKNAYTWCIEEKKSNQAIGSISVFNIDYVNKTKLPCGGLRKTAFFVGQRREGNYKKNVAAFDEVSHIRPPFVFCQGLPQYSICAAESQHGMESVFCRFFMKNFLFWLYKVLILQYNKENTDFEVLGMAKKCKPFLQKTCPVQYAAQYLSIDVFVKHLYNKETVCSL